VITACLQTFRNWRLRQSVVEGAMMTTERWELPKRFGPTGINPPVASGPEKF